VEPSKDQILEQTALLETIVAEARGTATSATRQSEHIGGLCIQYEQSGGKRKDIETRLKTDCLDTNVTRAIGAHTLVKMMPEALGLPIGVVGKFTPMVRWTTKAEFAKPKEGDLDYASHLPALVRKALAERWTADRAGVEAAKIRKPAERSGKKNPKGLADALRVIAKADLIEMMNAMLQNPQAASRIHEAEAHMEETLKNLEKAVAA
jgi:hypothetical protein